MRCEFARSVANSIAIRAARFSQAPRITRVRIPNGIRQWDVFPTLPFDGLAVVS
jgi:hypothetical protein